MSKDNFNKWAKDNLNKKAAAMPVEVTNHQEVQMQSKPAPEEPVRSTNVGDQARAHDYDYDADQESYVPVGLGGLLAASEKLLAVNRGFEDTDDRDSQAFKKYFSTNKLISERIRTDQDGPRKKLLRLAAQRKNLSVLAPFFFDGYTEKMLISNPLSSPLEEINPVQLVESARRVTQMGHGGIKSSDSITPEMQCHSSDTEVFTSTGWKLWPDVTMEDKMACRINGVMEFHTPIKLHSSFYEGEMHKASSRSINYLVTPNHRFWGAGDLRTPEASWKWETAAEIADKNTRAFACYSKPYVGTDTSDTYILTDDAESIEVDMGDWCEYLGWYMSEGSRYHNTKTRDYNKVVITQCPRVNPEKWEHIRVLLERLPFSYRVYGKNFVIRSKSLFTYVDKFGYCQDKYIPDFLFEVRAEYRRRFLDAFLAGDGWTQKSGGGIYSSCCKPLIDGIERLLLSLGVPATTGNPWAAKKRNGEFTCMMYRVNELTSPLSRVSHFQKEIGTYSGMIYCATVLGSLLLTRRGTKSKPFWNGNSVNASQFGFLDPLAGPESERAGVDARIAWGVKYGSNGRLYQMMKNRQTGKLEWVTPSTLYGKTVKLPD